MHQRIRTNDNPFPSPHVSSLAVRNEGIRLYSQANKENQLVAQGSGSFLREFLIQSTLVCYWNSFKEGIRRHLLKFRSFFYSQFGECQLIRPPTSCMFEFSLETVLLILSTFTKKRIMEWLMCFFQVTKERVKLLSHPLVTYLLRYKWRSFGRYVYYGRLILYGIFLFFLTGYAMHTTKSIPMTVCKEHECTCNVSFDTGSTGSRVVWRKIGLPVILITTSISIFLEVRNLHRYR